MREPVFGQRGLSSGTYVCLAQAGEAGVACMIRLRGHHLICLHFYRGEGYSREFVENLEDVLRGAEEGEEIEVVEDADDICRACPTLRGGKCVAAPEADTEIREMDA